MASPPEVPARARRPRVKAARLLVTAACVAALLVAGLLVARPHLFDDPLPAFGGRDSRCWRFSGPERKFARKMNRVRHHRHVHGLSLDPELSKVARKHTKEMVHRNLLYHTSQGALGHRVTRWSYLGENVGVGHTVASLHRAFMNSAGHRHNILMHRFQHSGVGVKRKRGRMWVTVIFESRRDPDTRLRMPRC